MATLFDALTATLPMERTHRQMGVENPMLKMLLQPELLAGLGMAGAGVGLGMAKMGGKKAAKEALQASERRVAKNILGGEVADDAAPVFYSRLARALAASDPNQRVRTMRDLEKLGLKGGGASRGEMTLLGERLGALKPVSTEALDQGKPAASAISWEEEIPLTAAARRRGSPENTVADILSEMEEAAPLELLDIPSATQYAEYTVPGGSQYAESSLHVPEDRPYLFGRGDETVPPTTLENLATYQPTRMGHFPGSLSFGLRKNRPMLNEAGEQIGTTRSLEQLQSDMMQMGKKTRKVLEETRPDLAKDLQKRWPAIALGRELRRAADEGLDAVTWHPAERVMTYNPGEPSGMGPFYGSETDPGQLGNIAKKMAKGIPGAEVKPVSVTGAASNSEADKISAYAADFLPSGFEGGRYYAGTELRLPPGVYGVSAATGQEVVDVTKPPSTILSAIEKVLSDRGLASDVTDQVGSAAKGFEVLRRGEPIPLDDIPAMASAIARHKNVYEAVMKEIEPTHKRLASRIRSVVKADRRGTSYANNPRRLEALRINDIADELYAAGVGERMPFDPSDDAMSPIMKVLRREFPEEMKARDDVLSALTPNAGNNRRSLHQILSREMSQDDWIDVFERLGVDIDIPRQNPLVMDQWGITLNEEAREYLRNNPLRLLGLGGAMAAPFSIMAAQPNRGA